VTKCDVCGHGLVRYTYTPTAVERPAGTARPQPRSPHPTRRELPHIIIISDVRDGGDTASADGRSWGRFEPDPTRRAMPKRSNEMCGRTNEYDDIARCPRSVFFFQSSSLFASAKSRKRISGRARLALGGGHVDRRCAGRAGCPHAAPTASRRAQPVSSRASGYDRSRGAYK
jgi:hypothetical protein